MEQTRDIELLEKLSGGDMRSWEALVQRHSTMVYSLAMRILQDSQDAEDAAQETFLRVRKSAQTFRFGEDARSWIAKIASREALKIMERRSQARQAAALREREAKSEAKSSARLRAVDAQEVEETRKSVQQAVDELPERLRAALVLHFGAGMNQSEIAGEIGCDRTTVADRIEQGLDALRRRLSQQGITAAVALTPAILAGSLTSEPIPALTLQRLLTLHNVASASVRVGAKIAAGKFSAAIWAVTCAGVLAAGVGTVWYRSAHAVPPSKPAAAPSKNDEGSGNAAIAVEKPVDPDADAIHFVHAGRLEGHLQLITALVFSPNGKTLASASYDHTVRLWDLSSLKEICKFSDHDLDVRSVAFSPQGLLASTTGDEHQQKEPGQIQLWDIAAKKKIASLSGHESLIDCVLFSPDGKTFVTGSWDNTIKIWDTASRKELKTLTGHTRGIAALAFSPDGTVLASGSWDHTARLWNTADWTEQKVLEGHSDRVWSLAFSPNGKKVVTGSFDGTLKLWDLQSGKALQTLSGHHGMVYSVAWSPNGKVIASGSGDDTQVDKAGELKLWNADTGTEIEIPAQPAGAVFAVAFSPDARLLLTAGGEKMSIDVYRAVSASK
jgi:RNA polymerase sigma factor (sigma-70 family)